MIVIRHRLCMKGVGVSLRLWWWWWWWWGRLVHIQDNVVCMWVILMGISRILWELVRIILGNLRAFWSSKLALKHLPLPITVSA